MARLKKAAAFLTAVMISASIASCADTSYALKANDEQIKAGVYIDYIYNEMTNQINTLYQSGVTSDFLSQKIDGKELSDYVAGVALKNVKEHAAINEKFDELKLTLDADTIKSVNSTVSDAWEQSGSEFEKQGISRESLKEVYLNMEKRSAVFNSIYAAGGTEEVTNDELIKYVNDNFLRYKIITFTKSADDEAANKESKAERDKYLKLADGLNFDEFDTVIDQYKKDQEAKQAAESEAAADDSSVDTAESEETEASNADVNDTLSSFEAEGDEESAVDVVSEDAAEANPYENESMTNYAALSKEDLESAYGKILTEINGLEVGKAAAYEDDSLYYLIIRGDASERSEEYIAEGNNQGTVLYQMKADDFQKKLDDWVSKITFDMNKDAVELYTVENIYNIQTNKD